MKRTLSLALLGIILSVSGVAFAGAWAKKSEEGVSYSLPKGWTSELGAVGSGKVITGTGPEGDGNLQVSGVVPSDVKAYFGEAGIKGKLKKKGKWTCGQGEDASVSPAQPMVLCLGAEKTHYVQVRVVASAKTLKKLGGLAGILKVAPTFKNFEPDETGSDEEPPMEGNPCGE